VQKHELRDDGRALKSFGFSAAVRRNYAQRTRRTERCALELAWFRGKTIRREHKA
jgi:hypothetical protein